MENTQKMYVKVNATYDYSGKMVPEYLMLADGRKYTIDKVVSVKPAATKAGGYGDCYTVLIHGQERHLFFEHNTASIAAMPGRWFVESR